MNVVAAILAGGRGERLRPITDYIPKPMIPVGEEEKPVLEHIIEWIKSFGVKDFVLLVGYRYKQIVNYFRDGDRWNITIRYSVDDDKYKGTGGALLKAYENGLFESFDHILVWYGDVIAKVDVKDLINRHEKEKCDVTIVATKNYRLPVGILNVSDDSVTEVIEKPVLDKFVGMGIFVFSYEVFEYLKQIGFNFDISYHYLPFLLQNKNIIVKVYPYTGWWVDIGQSINVGGENDVQNQN
ncbi:MAG: mannose-phosphate guanylyltransferase [Thermoanaerobacter sp.]|nr:mannose-phosphate guanylyltransferase [Thermoanaerobacter sp.]